MADLSSTIETLEHRLMRAWIRGDQRDMKAVLARDFMLLVGGERHLVLDRPSWAEAASTRFTCTRYRMSDVYVRRHGGLVLFATQLNMDAEIDDVPWSGDFWMVDLWRKSKVRRRWQLVERSLSRPDGNEQVVPAIRALQLWR